MIKSIKQSCYGSPLAWPKGVADLSIHVRDVQPFEPFVYINYIYIYIGVSLPSNGDIRLAGTPVLPQPQDASIIGWLIFHPPSKRGDYHSQSS